MDALSKIIGKNKKKNITMFSSRKNWMILKFLHIIVIRKL